MLVQSTNASGCLDEACNTCETACASGGPKYLWTTMTAEALRTELKAHHPFRIRTADGKVVPVPHPDFATLSPSGRTLIIFNQDDSYEVLDVRLISALESSAENQPG